MPLLRLPPATVYPTQGSVLDAPGRWWLLQVQGRFEVRVAADVVVAGCAAYVPLHLVTTAYASKAYTRLSPLFPNYVFLCVGDSPADQATAVYAARASGRVLAVIPVVQSDRLLSQLRAVEAALTENPSLGSEPLRAGERARVKRGPWMGREGVLCRETGRLCLPVEVLGRMVTVEIDPAALERI